MADRRLLAQSITNSRQVEQLVRKAGPWAALLFTWSIPFVDDDSRVDGDPQTLRSMVFGSFRDMVSVDDVEGYVAAINDTELGQWYEVADNPSERYLYLPRFSVHQTLRTDRYGPSRRPAPPGWRPESGHPYSRSPRLQIEKPQRDERKTRVIPKGVHSPQVELWTTDSQPGNGDESHSDTTQYLSSRHPTSPHLSPPHASAEQDAQPGAHRFAQRDGATRPSMRPVGDAIDRWARASAAREEREAAG